MKETIRHRARELGFNDCRITTARAPSTASNFQSWLAKGWQGEMTYLERNAGKRVDPQQVLPGAKSIIMLAASYETLRVSKGELDNEPNRPQPNNLRPRGVIARYARFQDYHSVLAKPLADLTSFVDRLGSAGTRSLWYVDTGPLLERDFAQRSGLGFVGKHTNVISRQLGNWFFLAEIITTLGLEPDTAERNRCGHCTKCLSACPTGAIKAPFQLDARLCISYLTIELKGSIPVELRRAIGNRIYGCDDCLAACPWNRFAKDGQLMKSQVRQDLETPELIELLKLNEAAFKQRFVGTPILRTKRRGLLRNVCVALGNVGDKDAVPALQQAANDPEPLISEHAQWALDQISARSASRSVATSNANS